MVVPHIVGEKHYRIAQNIRRTLAEYEDLKDIKMKSSQNIMPLFTNDE